MAQSCLWEADEPVLMNSFISESCPPSRAATGQSLARGSASCLPGEVLLSIYEAEACQLHQSTGWFTLPQLRALSLVLGSPNPAFNFYSPCQGVLLLRSVRYFQLWHQRHWPLGAQQAIPNRNEGLFLGVIASWSLASFSPGVCLFGHIAWHMQLL